jgi:signal transduction histidine kinase
MILLNKKNLKTLFDGIAIGLLTIVLIEIIALYVLKIASSPIYLLAISIISYKSGKRTGIICSFLFIGYYIYYFSHPNALFHFSEEDIKKMLSLSVITFILAYFTGHLKAKYDHVLLQLKTSDELVKAQEKKKIPVANVKQEKPYDPHEQLRQLAAHLQVAREEERKSIAREIHDELGQVLTALKIDLSLFTKLFESTPPRLTVIQEEIEVMKKLVDKSLDTVNKIVQELRPSTLKQLGLINEIKSQANMLSSKSNIAIDVYSEVLTIKLSLEKKIEIYRIMQEALTNVLRHAKASHVAIYIKEDFTKYIFEVSDNGVGIKEKDLLSQTSFGIMGMKERAIEIGANLHIKKLAQGTGIFLHIKKD